MHFEILFCNRATGEFRTVSGAMTWALAEALRTGCPDGHLWVQAEALRRAYAEVGDGFRHTGPLGIELIPVH